MRTEDIKKVSDAYSEVRKLESERNTQVEESTAEPQTVASIYRSMKLWSEAADKHTKYATKPEKQLDGVAKAEQDVLDIHKAEIAADAHAIHPDATKAGRSTKHSGRRSGDKRDHKIAPES